MAVPQDGIFVRSHVPRDLLQNAALFKTDKLVVWEYVSNSLQYVDPGTLPVVRVTLDNRKKRISIADNGRGMDWGDLQNFFVMHGENVDRREGRPGRGRFGTGKSAAFGIADLLHVTTQRGGKRSRVELRRNHIEQMTSEDPIPVRTVEKEVTTSGSNGTTIEIEEIHLRSLDQPGVIRYIERHLARWPRNVTVLVNNHECEFCEPAVAEERRFTPEGGLEGKLGDVEFVIRVSKAPLDDDLRGVSIFSNSVWHETTLAGSEGREMSQYLFGEIDVPALDYEKSPLSPFDLSRSMRLNPSNELVQALYAFIGQKVEEVRRDLLEAEKRRRASEEAKKLAQEAAQIARIINQDFDEFRQRLAKARAKVAGSSDLHGSDHAAGSEDNDLLFGSDLPAEVISETGAPGATGGNGGTGGEPRDMGPQVIPAEPEAEKKGQRAGGIGDQPKPRGGFQVKFEHMGSESHRALYVSATRSIVVNLDHPQLVAAGGAGAVDDLVFKRLAYEIAFSEYAVALASELAARDEYLDPSDPIWDIRDTMNRVARRGASLFSAHP